jgi:hypothetical protein
MRGFGGQSLTVHLMTEHQLVGPDPPSLATGERSGGPQLNSILARALRDGSFTYLRGIDEYGVTIFNYRQMDQLVSELKRLSKFTETEPERQVLQEVLNFAARVTENDRMFLAFLGD